MCIKRYVEPRQEVKHLRKLLSEVYLELADKGADKKMLDRVSAAANGAPADQYLLQSIATSSVDETR